MRFPGAPRSSRAASSTPAVGLDPGTPAAADHPACAVLEGRVPKESIPVLGPDGRPDIVGTLRRFDRQLVAQGWHGLSPAWHRILDRVHRRGGPRVSVVRGGRRGGKSVTYERLACAVAYCSPPPGSGDVGVFAILSANRRQAGDRLARCRRVFDALGVGYSATASEIRLPHGTMIRATTASVTDAVSSTLIGAFLDEMALWNIEGANPAKEIFSLLAPSITTVPWGVLHLVSAPYTTRDPHAEFYDRAEREKGWHRAHVPTWVGNPTLTEADCRMLAESDEEFERAYAANPIDTIADFMYPPTLLEAAAAQWAVEDAPPRVRSLGDQSLAALAASGYLANGGRP